MGENKTTRREYLKVAGGTVAGLAVGGAVGYYAGVSTAPQPSPTPTPGPTPTPTPAPTKLTFIQLEQHDPVQADPAKWADFVGPWTFTHGYDALACWGPGTEGPAGTPSMMPMLARRWEVSQDKKTYTFHLREGVLFHDGNLMTADDVVYTLKRMLVINEYPVSLYSEALPVDNVEKLDKYTARANLTMSSPLFAFGMPLIFVLSSKTIEANIKTDGPYGDKGDYATEWIQTHDAGAGPYAMKERVIGDHVSWVRWPQYWGGWRHRYFDEGVYKIVHEAATQVQMIKAGEADRIGAWLPVALYADLEQEPDLKTDYDVALEFYLAIWYNTQKEGLNNVHVRRALNYCFDYDKCVNDIFRGWVERLEGPIPKGITYFNPNVPMYELDLVKAQEEFDQSGYAAGELTFEAVALSLEEQRKDMLLLLADGASQIGININVVEQPWATWMERALGGPETAPEMTVMIPMSTYPDPDNYLYSVYHSKMWKVNKMWSLVYLDDPVVDDMLDTARYEPDDSKRRDMYYELQTRIAENAYSCFAVKGEPNFSVMRKDIGGYEWWPYGAVPSYMPLRWHKYIKLTAAEM